MSSSFDIFGLGADPDDPESSPARKAQLASAQPLPKRFYEKVEIVDDDGFVLHLDGRPVRTPARSVIRVYESDIATQLAEEWRAQKDVINPKTMPLTRLINSAIDGVATSMDAVREEIVRFAGTDLLCYRAEAPERFVDRQTKQWDPIIKWAEERYSCQFLLAAGVLHVMQPEDTITTIQETVAAYQDPLCLAALHAMTTLMGSCLLALVVAEKHMSAKDAWRLAHLDEDWNIEQWGGDHDAEARRAYRWLEMQAAALVASR